MSIAKRFVRWITGRADRDLDRELLAHLDLETGVQVGETDCSIVGVAPAGFQSVQPGFATQVAQTTARERLLLGLASFSVAASASE